MAATSGVAAAINGALARRHGTGPRDARRRWWRHPRYALWTANDVLDAGTPLTGRPSTVRNRLDRPLGKVAASYAAMPSATVRRLTGQVPTNPSREQPSGGLAGNTSTA
jgi:hypothetical protein